MAIDPSDSDVSDSEEETTLQSQGPWVLIVTAKGQGKRVPVSQFRLQKRAGLGLRAIKFRQESDEMVALWVVSSGQELMVVTNRGIIIRQAADDIPQQSRAATGVRVQRLNDEDAIAAVALVPTVETDPAHPENPDPPSSEPDDPSDQLEEASP